MFTDWEVDDRIRSSPISTLELSGATARLSHQPFTHTFTELAKAVRSRGLQGRRRGFYVMIFAVLVLALAGSATGMILLDDSWLQLLLAGALGVIFTQFAFLGHEASHRQIFESGRANDRSGRVLAALVGISYGWWMNKHSRHHANPNKIGKDPDIESDTVSFLEESAAARKGALAWITRRQGYLFFPLLLLEGLNLHVKSINSLSAGDRSLDRAADARGALHDLLRFDLLAVAVRHGVGFHRGAACCLRPLHGRDLCAESQGHADHPG